MNKAPSYRQRAPKKDQQASKLDPLQETHPKMNLTLDPTFSKLGTFPKLGRTPMEKNPRPSSKGPWVTGTHPARMRPSTGRKDTWGNPQSQNSETKRERKEDKELPLYNVDRDSVLA